MSAEIWLTIIGLALATFAIRLGGYLLALRVPQSGAWAKAMEALPGCLIVGLVAMMMLQGSLIEWVAGVLVFAVAAATKNLLIAMIVGLVSVAGLRLVLL